MNTPLHAFSDSLAAPAVDAPLRFWHRAAIRHVPNVPPHMTLLSLLRDELKMVATKEGCAAGDCGACTVVVGENVRGRLHYRAVNSCIKPAHSIDGLALWTAADLARGPDQLHPVQEAMVMHHGSQCGFCTPGFVMSLFGLYQNTIACGRTVNRHAAHEALSGNLCRCTGYRPIIDAACQMKSSPDHRIDEAQVLQSLDSIPTDTTSQPRYFRPSDLTSLLQARAQYPQALLTAGATDVGLWITQGLQEPERVIDLTRVPSLRRIETSATHIEIGAAVSLQEAFDALAQGRPAIAPFAARFAGWPIRQSGTLGGNVANGSPIGDSMPLLIALDARLVLMAWRDERIVSRQVAVEDFYTGYRQNLLAADEILSSIVVPKPSASESLHIYKVSKRHEDDISAVCLAICMQHQNNHIRDVRIGAGGVAATPARARLTEQAMRDRPLDDATLHAAQATIAEEFRPLSDLRASAAYRRTLLVQLLARVWLEIHGHQDVRLEVLP